MKKVLFRIIPVLAAVASLASCLKNNDKYESYDSLKPIADLPKAKANAVKSATPTTSWMVLDTVNGGVDYKTAVHISYKDHVGDIVVKMKIDKDAAQTWLSTLGTAYKLIPDSLYTVASTDVTIPNAGVFSTGDFVVHIKSNAKDASGANVFRSNKFVLPVSIDSVASSNYTIASNFQTILWYIKVK
jgi:hypothetical protein